MTLVQLQYIVALDAFRHFGRAAEYCFVTQPSLSGQVQKLEDELGTILFDRSVQPIVPTEAGAEIVRIAKEILAKSDELKEAVEGQKSIVNGHLKVGIIPTLAPYLIPLFLGKFLADHPMVKLSLEETTTKRLLEKLRQGAVDVGLLATPINEPGMVEETLFFEDFVVYASPKEAIAEKKYVLPKDIDPQKLWLLEEGHCFRGQIIQLCELKKKALPNQLDYQAGSLETLRNLVERYEGLTVLPELSAHFLSEAQLPHLCFFETPVPQREIGIVKMKDVSKKKLINALKKTILDCLPDKIKRNQAGQVMPIV